MYIAWAEVRDAPCACILQPSNHRTRPELPEFTFHARVLCHARRSVIWSLFLTEPSFGSLQVPGYPRTGFHQPRDAGVVSFWRCGSRGRALATAPFCGLQIGTPCQALDSDTAGRSYWPLTST
jgi:hypothetical protein